MTKNIIIKRDIHEDSLSRAFVDKWIFYILTSVVALVPLIVFGHVTEVISPLIDNRSLLESGRKLDIFTFYKFIVLLILTITGLGLFLYKLLFLGYCLPRKNVLIFFGIFLSAILLSLAFSSTKTIALFGQYNRTDGSLSYICYMVLMFLAMHINYQENSIKKVLYVFTPVIIINFILTTLNFMELNILNFNFVESIINLFVSDEINFESNSALVGTLNHNNYMSGMFAILFLTMFSWVLIDNKISRIIFTFILSFLSFGIVLMSLSKSGVLTILCFIPIFIWFLFKNTNRKSSLIKIVSFSFVAIFLFHTLASENPKVWDESLGMLVSSNPYKEKTEKTNISDFSKEFDLKEIFYEKGYAEENKFKLPVLPESGVGFGSGRIYIWKNTFELISKKPLTGYGLDTLMYNFPHNDLELRANLETENVIIDKPHNMYLGILYGTGLLGFIGFIGIILITVKESLKNVFTFKNSKLYVLLSVAWLAFLFQAIFNDTLPGIGGPLFIIGGMTLSMQFNKTNGEHVV